MQEIPVEQIGDYLAGVGQRLATVSLREPLTEVVAILRSGFADHFAASSGPVGAWPARKDAKPHAMLNETGDLLAAATGSGSGAVTDISDREAACGIDKTVDQGGIPGAAVHNFGFPPRNIPQREYLWADEDVLNQAVDVLADAVYAAVFAA